MNNTAVKKNTSAAAMFFICTLAAALLGFLSGFFSGAFSNLVIDEWLAAAVYAGVCFLSGFCLFSILTAYVKNRTYYLIRNWAVMLWSVQFIMFLASPFLTDTVAYVWLSILSAIITALAILNFKLRFIGAIAMLPVLGWIIFSCYTVISQIG